jgi:hypothetical protein
MNREQNLPEQGPAAGLPGIGRSGRDLGRRAVRVMARLSLARFAY